MSNQLSLDDVKKALPTKRNVVTKEAVDIINQSMNDPEFQGESLIQTAAIYEGVLKGSRATVPEYLNAIRFCAYMSTNDSNYTEAYKKVFADREFVKERVGLPSTHPKYSELTSAASRYRKTKLVVEILTVSQVPLDLIFTGARYKAIAVLTDKMQNSKLDRDAISAAKELLAATKGAEDVKISLDVGIKEDSAVQKMNDQLAMLASRQKGLLESGSHTLEEFGSMKVKDKETIEGELVE